MDINGSAAFGQSVQRFEVFNRLTQFVTRKVKRLIEAKFDEPLQPLGEA
jgi:hypothetical protein